MKCASLLRETMWSMVQEIHSELDFDYPAYTMGRAAEMLNTTQGFLRAIGEALSYASDLLHIAMRLADDAAMVRGTDRYAWASCYLQEMSKAVIDDVVKVLEAPGSNPA